MRLFLLSYFIFFSTFVSIYAFQDQGIINDATESVDLDQQLDTLFDLASKNLVVNDSLSIQYANQMLEVAKLMNDELDKGRAAYVLGKALRSSSPSRALEYVKQATLIIEKFNDSLLADVYYVQSDIYTTFSEFPSAMRFGLKSLKYNQSIKNKRNIQRDMSFIGYIHDRMYEYRESMRWNRSALEIAKELNDKSAQAICYGRIGIAYDELAENDNFNKQLFDSALYYNLKAVQMSKEAGDLGFTRITYSNIGNSYSKLKQYEKAEEYTLKSLAVPGFEDRKGVTLVNLGKIYLETGRYNEAKKILDSAMQNTIQYGTRKYQFEAYYRMHELDIKKGDYKSALQHYISYKSLEDSLLNETKTKQIAEMSERFKSAEKEIQLAETRATLAEKDLDIQQKNVQLIGLIIASIVFSVLGYLVYNQQKLKNKQLQKENELKDALARIETQNKLQEQRLNISRDLHDNIGAQLTFIISTIDNLKYGFTIEDKKLTNKLSGISEFTKDTIYELRDTIWAMNKNEITFEDLESRISNFIDKANIAAKGINFNFKVSENITKSTKFSSVEGINIYRIIQEAINNALKYAKANNISVLVDQNNENFEIEIVDDGKGFDKNNSEEGNGLNNMRKRAYEIKAKINIKSKLKKGTTIRLTRAVNT